MFTEHRSVVGNEDEGSISNNSSPSATESSRIDEMFMETKKYDRTCQVPDEGERIWQKLISFPEGFGIA